MVKAEITIRTCYGEAVIPVQVLGKGPQPGTAWVQALNGLAPFTRISHGGPYQDNTALVQIPNLHEVRIENDPVENRMGIPAQENGIAVQLPIPDERIPADWFLESAYEDRTCSE